MTMQFTDPLFSDANGYDRDGYDKDGVNRDGYDRDGSPRNVLARDLNLANLWNSFHTTSRHAFFRYLESITRDPEMISNVEFCTDCGEPVWREDTSPARDSRYDERVCDNCLSDWPCCESCEGNYPAHELTEVLNGQSVCERCRDSNYGYCDYCDGYYHNDDSDEHDPYHGRYAGCCESPQRQFSIRNDGEAPLPNDTRVTVTLPAGIITQEGLNDIRQYLRRQKMPGSGPFTRWPSMEDLSCDLYLLGDEWQTREGNYAKRLSRLAYTSYSLKLSPEVLSQVGVIAREHSGSQNAYQVEVTRDLNQNAAYFYHEDSCWWGSSYGESRCALKTNGGFGLRSFNDYGSLAGRAWVMPLRKTSPDGSRLTPTFDTETPDAFVVFNGYGELSGYAAPRILSHMAGWTYRRTGFECAPMYVNAGGYLIGPEDLVNRHARSVSSGLYIGSLPRHATLFNQEQTEKAAAARRTAGCATAAGTPAVKAAGTWFFTETESAHAAS